MCQMYQAFPVLRRYFVFFQVDVHLKCIEKLKPDKKGEAVVNGFYVEKLKRGSVYRDLYLDVFHTIETTVTKFVEFRLVVHRELKRNP